MRVVHIADDAEVHARVGGVDAAVRMLRSRSGTEFDPTLVELCTRENGALLDGLDRVDAWQQVIDGCAALARPIADDELTDVLTVFADYSDAKATWFLGHSRAVADWPPPRRVVTACPPIRRTRCGGRRRHVASAPSACRRASGTNRDH